MFKIGYKYTRNQIHEKCGGSKQSYLPTVNNIVVAVCLRPDLNPGAPAVVLCGMGKITSAVGGYLGSQLGAVPVFVKSGVNLWEFRGMFGVKAAHSSGARFSELIASSGRNEATISMAIELVQIMQ